MVTRELLYTALTRQKEKVVVLLQGSATDLTASVQKDTQRAACRLTNLFGPPNPVEVKGVFLEERLIHNTMRGELVRSSRGHHCEPAACEGHRLRLRSGIRALWRAAGQVSDFTIEDDDSGKTYYWEHLGMLDDRATTRNAGMKKNSGIAITELSPMKTGRPERDSDHNS
ncbi:MAG: hypothetical protein R3C11_27780 [Planctomycetaceae bacterium]